MRTFFCRNSSGRSARYQDATLSLPNLIVMKAHASNSVQAFWFGLGKVVSLSFTVVVAMVLSRYLDVREYGTYKQILFVYGTLQVVFTAGLPRAYGYYLARGRETEARGIIGRLTWPLLGSGLLFSLLLYFGAPWLAVVLRNPELEHGFRLFAPIPFFLLPTLGLEAIYSTIRRSHIVALYQLATRSLMLLTIVAPVVLVRPDYKLALVGWNISSLASFFAALYLKYRPFPGSTEPPRITYPEVFKYVYPLFTASLYGIAYRSADKFLISRYFGEATFAQYANGFMDLPFVAMVSASTAAVLLPIFAAYMDKPDRRQDIVNTWLGAWKKSAIVVYPLLIFFFVHADGVMTLLYGSQYTGSAAFFRVALVANVSAVIAFVPLILAMGETRFYSLVHLVTALVMWAGGYGLVHLEASPLAIAALAAVIDVLKAVVFMRFIANKISIPFSSLVPFRHLSTLIAHSTIVALLGRLLLPPTDHAGLVALAVAFGCFCALLLLTSRVVGISYWSVAAPIFRRG